MKLKQAGEWQQSWQKMCGTGRRIAEPTLTEAEPGRRMVEPTPTEAETDRRMADPLIVAAF